MNLQTVSLKEWNEGEEKGIFQQMLEKAFKEWNEADHPRVPAGSSEGGQWVSSEGGESNIPNQEQLWNDMLAKVSPQARSSAKRKISKDLADRLSKNPAFAGMAPKEILKYCQEKVDLWAETSGDSNSKAIALQLAAQEEFGLGKDAATGHYSPASRKEAADILKSEKGKSQAFLRAMYDNTQAYFKEKGITELYLARGMSTKVFIWNETKDVKDWHEVSNEYPRILARAGETKLAPMSSYSLSVGSIAKVFSNPGYTGGKKGDSRILMGKVPVKDILSTPFTGAGCMTEGEVVVLGGKRSQVVLASIGDKGVSTPPKVERFSNKTETYSGTREVFRTVLSKMRKEKKGWINLPVAEGSAALFPDDELEDADWPKRTNDVMNWGAEEKGFKEWNEADHPREPAGSSEGGQFTSSDGGSGEPSKLIPIEDLIAEAKKRMKKYENLWQAPEALVILVSPLRQTKEALEEMQYVASASSFDAMVRTVSSKMKWQLGWAAAADEWEAANHLGGNKQASKLTKEELSGPPQGYSRPRLAFTEEDKKAYRARQAWMQKKFRQEYGEEIELYRGVKGAYAKKLPESGEVDLPAYALSSWSANAYDAQQFMGKTPAARRSGRLLKTKVKVSDIWLLPRVGTEDVIRVADARDEVVVLNKDKTRRATVI